MRRAFQRFFYFSSMKLRFLIFSLLSLSVAPSFAGIRSLYEQEEYGRRSCSNLVEVDYNPEDHLMLHCGFATCPDGSPKKYHGCNDDKTLYISPNVHTFVRDAEYFLPYTKGYTALGFFLKPTFTYRHDEHLSVSAGIDLMGIAGDHKKIRGISPIVSIRYSPIKNITIIGGTLTNLGHYLSEPMWDYDRNFYAHKEDGLQIFVHTKHWKTEMWCNWEDFIVVGSPWQEKFTFGWSNRFQVYEKNNHSLEIPINLMMNHRGGQIDAVEDTCIETLANASIAIEYIGLANRLLYIAEVPFYGFSNRSNEEHIHTHFKDGWGIYPKITLGGGWIGKRHDNHNSFGGGVGYWYGDGFISGRGSYLFQSRGYFDDSFERRYRHMLTANAYYRLNDIFNFLFQAYYDLDEKGIDYAVTFSLNFDKKFKIHTWK